MKNMPRTRGRDISSVDVDEVVLPRWRCTVTEKGRCDDVVRVV